MNSEELQKIIRQRDEEISHLEKRVKSLVERQRKYQSKLFRVKEVKKSYPRSIVTELEGTVGGDGEAFLPAPHTFYVSGGMAQVAFFDEKNDMVFRDRVYFKRGVNQAFCGLQPGKLIATVVGIGTEGYVTFDEDEL